MSRRTFIRRFEGGDRCIARRVGASGTHGAGARSLPEATRLSIEAGGDGLQASAPPDALRHHFRTRLDTSPARYRGGFRA